jgi:hypothetical protein
VVEDLVANDACHFKTLFVRHRVDDQVPMDADEMLRVEDAIFVLERHMAVSGVFQARLGRSWTAGDRNPKVPGLQYQ